MCASWIPLTTISSTSDSPLFYIDDKQERRSFSEIILTEKYFKRKEFSFEILVERSLTIWLITCRQISSHAFHYRATHKLSFEAEQVSLYFQLCRQKYFQFFTKVVLFIYCLILTILALTVSSLSLSPSLLEIWSENEALIK